MYTDYRLAEVSETIPTPERALLAKLEEENRRIEADAKCPSLTNVHSRKSSDTSQVSLASGKQIDNPLCITIMLLLQISYC